jgi:gliding motility-associated-like protein
MKRSPILLFCFLLFISGKIYAQAQVEFVENKGQWGNWFNYKASTKGGDICLEKDGFRYVMADPHNNSRLDSFEHGIKRDVPILKFHCYKVTFEGADMQDKIQGEKPFKVYYNYFHGNDSSRWKSGIHPCRNVNYTGLYKGIDMHVNSEKGNMVYDFTIEPQANAAQIKLKFEGQDNIEVSNGNLMVHTSVGDVSEMKPYAYQYINYERVEVSCAYSLKGNELSFDFPNDYDHSNILFIDPTVVFCTMTGSTADNWGFTATYDEAGNFYNGGLVNCIYFGGTYPVSPGSFQTTFGGGYSGVGPLATDSTYASDIAIIKYNPTGTDRIYATYLGGSNNERPTSMIVDPGGDLIVAGRTESINFPVTTGAFQTSNGGNWDICLTKFNPTGTALIGSTYLGGSQPDGVNFDSSEWGFGNLKFNYGDDARSEVQIDNSGNIYIASCTNSGNFPITPATALSASLSGLQDGVVCKFNSTLTTMLWGTYIGGNGSDAGYVLAFDTSQASLFVAGGTNSTDFPVTAGTLHTTFQGGRADGFILKFQNSAPYNLQKGTYVGTSNYDQVYGIQVSDDNQVYVMGQSLGGGFPVTTGVYSNAHSCQFIMETDSNLTSDLVSTVYGNGDADSTNISPVAFLVDTCGNVYISGWGGDLGITSPIEATGTAVGMPVTSDAIRNSSPSGRDFYFIVLGSGMATLRYGTYYGRTCPLVSQIWEGCHVDGGTSRFNKQGIIYQAMCADCGGIYNAVSNPNGCVDPFPTTSGVWSMVDSSANCNEAALKIAFNIGPVDAVVSASPNTTGCAPFTVNFTNSSTNALTYLWNFGDGSATTTSFSASHTFVAAGTYTVTLSAANSNACFVTNDTAHLVIVVDSNSITPTFTYSVTSNCSPFGASFVNTSTSHVTGDTSSYTWLFGDGSSYLGTTPPLHTYADSGTYIVSLIMANLGACQSPDTITQSVSFHSFLVSAKFTAPDSVCLGTPVTLIGGGTNATSTLWNFGDGHSSTEATSYAYDSIGTFTITLIAQNSGACNLADTFTQVVSILQIPTANFSYTPITPQANVPSVFTNLSVNANSYLWNFGDNTTSAETNPTHQYNKSGEYNVCLTAYNKDNCPSQICKEAPADVEPIVGIPSAFSPNGDGENDILYVRGAAISTLDLKIFNRWGQLVFETTSQQKGWDGTYNGQPQPIDAYAYVLRVTFIDGTGKVLKGNITLLR